MKSTFARCLALIVGVVGLFASARAQESGSDLVTYNPYVRIAEGNEPYTLTTQLTSNPPTYANGYTLSITGPTDASPSAPITVSPVFYVVTAPTGADVVAAASWVTYTPASLTFTQPNQVLSYTVNLVMPATAVAGAYSYGIYNTGWTANDEDDGAFINVTLLPPVVTANSPPTVTISQPLPGQYFYYPGSSVSSLQSVTIPITAIGAIQTGGDPVTALSINASSVPLATAITFNSPVTGGATGNATFTTSTSGSYTFTAVAQNIDGSSAPASVTVQVIAIPPPTITINPVADGSILYIPIGSTSITPAFSITGNSQVNISAASATLSQNGTPIATFAPTFSGLNSLAIASNGTLPALTPGTYTITATDSNVAGTGNATSTFTVVQGVPPAITINEPTNGSEIAIPNGALTVAVPYTITGTTAVALINTASASMTVNLLGIATPVLTFLPSFSGLGTASTAIATGSVLLGAGTYTITATDTNSIGGSANATPVTFTVAAASNTTAVPSVAITSPTTSSFVIPSGASSVSIPYAFTGSTSGGILDTILTSASVTLNGVVINPLSLIGLGLSSTISGSGTLANLGPGTYTLTVTDSNGAILGLGGTATASQSFTFTVAQAATPAIAISAPANGSTVTIAAGQTTVAVPYTIKGTTNGTASTVDNAITSAAAVISTTSGNVGAGFSPTFTGVNTATAIDTGSVILAVGTYTITATDSNGAPLASGGTATAQASTTFTVVQAAAPAISITAPGQGASLTIPAGATTIAVPYAIAGKTTGVTATTVDNTILNASATITATSGTIGAGFVGTFTGVPSASVADSGAVTLSAGSYTISAQDGNGAPGVSGTASAAVSFTIAQSATPTITISAPGSGSTVTVPAGATTVGVPYTITGGTSGGTLFNTIISANATITTTNGTIGGGFSNAFNGVTTSSITNSGTVTLSPGTYTISAQDANGATGTGTASQSITFTVVQAAAPAISITAPANGATLTIPAGSTTLAVPYAISGTTSGGTAYNTITSASATLTATSGTIGAGFTGTFTGLNSATATDNGTVTLSAGTYTIAAQDANGAPGTGTASQSITFTVVQAATPAISITAPVNGATIYLAAGATTAAVPYTVTGTTNGTSSTTDNTITSASATLTSPTGTIGAGFTGTFTGLNSATATDSGTVTLSAGVYTLAATDSNGAPGTTGTASQSITFTVAPVQPPTITINPPANGATYAVGSNGTAAVPYSIVGTTPSGTAFTSATPAVALLTASGGGSVSGVTQPTFTGYGATSTSITATGTFNLTAGTYTLTANDTNNSGGKATATPVTFTVTATCSAPTVTSSSTFCVSRVYAGSYIWFDSTIDVTGMSSTAGTLQFNNPSIVVTISGAAVTLAAPSATVTFSSTATSATTTYDAPSNSWLTTVPVGYTGSIFLTGVAYPVTGNYYVSGGTVVWSGSFMASAQGVTGLWQTAATVYSPFTSSLNSLGIKAVDSGSLCSYHTSDPAGTPENYASCGNGSCCSSNSSGNGSTPITGLYASGVSGTGSLLAGGSTDSHWVVTASSLGSAYLGNAYVDPTPLAGGWVSNSSTAQWITAPGGVNIGNGGGNNGLPSSGSTSQTDTYDYTLSFSLPAGATVGTTNITGTLSADDSVLVFVNGSRVTSGVPNATDYEYNTTSAFTLNANNANFQAGTNTITFRVANENSPTPKNASGLYVQSLGGTITVPTGQVAITYCASLGGHSTQGTGNPPTTTATSPANSSVFAYSAGSPASVPVAFTVVSPANSGNVTAVSATLNGQPITLTSITGLNSSATATAGATLSISQAGTYTLVYTGSNAYGSDTDTTSFTVVQATPPTITISAPLSSARITITSGTTASVPYAFNGSTNYGTITAVTASLGSSSLSPTVTGLNSTAINGSGTLTLAAGTYTLTATDTNIAGSASASVTFTVVSGSSGCGSGSDSGSEVLTWLQCNSFNSSYNCSQNNDSKVTVTGGAVVPVTFTLNGSSHNWSDNWNGGWDNTCNSSTFVSDTSVVISICEVFSNNSSSTPVIYTYGASGPNPPYFSIGNNQYLLYFPTASGTHHYEVQVYHPLSSGSNLQLLGSEDIYTQASCMPSTGTNGSNFNGTPISSGRYIWFNSVINCSGISSQECTLWFDTSSISFTLGKTACVVAAPAACIKFDPNCRTATTTFNAATNCWVTSVPVGYTGNVFLTGTCYQVPAGFPTGLNPVTWTGCFRGDNGNCNAQWQWAAAVYTQCPSNLNQLGVKPCDSNSNTQYANSDHAGTPENYKNCVTGGARGSGGSNWTGSYSGTVAPSVGTNCWMSSSVPNSGWGNDSNNGWGSDSNSGNNGWGGNGWGN